jgi:hypothetical protein
MKKTLIRVGGYAPPPIFFETKAYKHMSVYVYMH